MAMLAENRLHKHADYQRVYKGSRKQFGKLLAYFAASRSAEAQQRSATPGPRVGLTVPKALGKAVDRNRIKRRLREAVRGELALLGTLPVDVVLHPKRTVLEADFAAIAREVGIVFRSVAARHAAAPAAKAASPKSAKASVPGAGV